MVEWSKYGSQRLRLSLGAAALVVAGAAGGAGAIGLTRPAVEMAPAQPVAISSLPNRDGLVTVRGKVAEVYGDRFTLIDGSGKTMVDAGRDGSSATAGSTMMVQGRYDDGQLRASFLIDGSGKIEPVGPRGRPHPRGPDGPGGPGRGGPGGPRGPRGDGPPPPPPGCVPGMPGAAVAPPPPAANNATPAPVPVK